ncbi:MFS general substrate transporter [Thozetella sp. PMI_491]|nr:MFS general substrate transporter [Thozetella sp. PMI_491]
MAENEAVDPAWPPGTIRLEILGQDNEKPQIVLQPRPTRDPNDPLNWPLWRKYTNFGLACFYAMIVFAQISASTPTWGPMGDELNFSTETLNDTWAIGCATLALGSFMLIPFALKYGLRPIYVLSSVAQLGIMVWGAETQTAGDWWGVNALQCWLGSLAECMVQMTVADVFFVHQRGVMNTIYIWISNMGGSLAPVAVGFITDSQGWRWVWWWLAIIFGIETLLFVFLFEESKFHWASALQVEDDRVATVINKQLSPEGLVLEKNDKDAIQSAPAANTTPRDAEKQLQAEEAKSKLYLTELCIDLTLPRRSYWQRLVFTTDTPGHWTKFARHSWQPFEILFTIPGVAYMSLVYAILLAWGAVMSAAMATYMLEPPYNFTSTGIGLMSLAGFIGNTLGSIACGPISDWIILQLAKRTGGIYEPEMRLWIFIPFIPFQVAGAFWFGYALQDGESWIAVAVASAMCHFGRAPLSSIALTYMTDAYNEIIGDALVGLTFARNTFSTIFVFAMTPWIAAVGMANVFNIIGVLGLVILLFSFVFIWQGKRWRFTAAKRYKYYAQRQFDPRPLG